MAATVVEWTGKTALIELKRFASVKGSLPKFPTLMCEVIKKDLDKLEELTKVPTIEEVQKEWEALGYECIGFDKKFIKLVKNIFNVQKITIEICYGEDFRYMKYGESRDSRLFTLEEHNLITKTIKALEREEKHDYS